MQVCSEHRFGGCTRIRKKFILTMKVKFIRLLKTHIIIDRRIRGQCGYEFSDENRIMEMTATNCKSSVIKQKAELTRLCITF